MAGPSRLWKASERIVHAVAHPIRIKILTRMSSGPLSPKEFRDENPGYSLPTVAKHFRRLEELGYIEEVWEGPYGSRVFGIQRFAFFDKSSLIRLGAARRDWTGAVASSYAERIAEALEASTFACRGDSRFLWTPLFLDDRAWTAGVMAVDALFYFSVGLHLEAAGRLTKSGETPIVATAGFGFFESPDDSAAMPIVPPMRLEMGEHPGESSDPVVDEAVRKAFGHPIRVRILAALKRRPLSPTDFCGLNPQYGLQVVAKHFRVLEALGWVEVIKERTGFADVTIFCLRPSYTDLDQAAYTALPEAIRQDAESVLVTTYMERLADAVVAGTINPRPDSHLSWTGLQYDEQAWSELVFAIDRTYHFALLLQHHAVRRLDASGNGGFPVTLGCACFPSPGDAQLVDSETLATVEEQKSSPYRRHLARYLDQLLHGPAADSVADR